ncbi:MAG TPA: hypothetical protein GX746_05560 [Bacteroidales bacterium]|nr:hypothetical protein [Bacteroidales bacterium]
MKKYLFLVATLLLTVTMSVSAQRNSGNRRNNINNRRSEQVIRMTPQEKANLITKELDLTAKESAEVLAMYEKQDKERIADVNEQRSERGMGAENRDVRREEFRTARDAQMKQQFEELVKIIGKEKAEKWNELRKDVRFDNRTGRRNPGNRNR